MLGTLAYLFCKQI